MWMWVVISGAVLVALGLSGFRIAQEYERGVVFRLGRYQAVRGPGLYWNIPLIEWQRKLDLRTTTVAVEQQESITKDSVTIKVDAVLWYRIVDPAKAVIAVRAYGAAVYQVALTTLRNIIGQHVLDEVLKGARSHQRGAGPTGRRGDRGLGHQDRDDRDEGCRSA